jgi:hypothetical protein
VLRHGIAIALRGVDASDAELLGILLVNVLHSGPCTGNETEVRVGIEELAVYLDPAPDDDAVKLRQLFQHLLS